MPKIPPEMSGFTTWAEVALDGRHDDGRTVNLRSSRFVGGADVIGFETRSAFARGLKSGLIAG